MTSVRFTVAGQHLKRITTPFLVKDSRNYISLDFSFLTKDWLDVAKKVIFNDKYEETIENDTVIVPQSCSTIPEFTVSVYGFDSENDVLITTNKLTIQLEESGYIDGTILPLEEEIQNLKNQINILESEKSTLESEKTTLERERAELEQTIIDKDNFILELEARIDQSGVLA